MKVNSDRRAPKAVKTYAQNNPHRMGAWSSDSKSHVHMSGGDFFGSEQSRTFDTATSVFIIHVATDGQRTVLKSGVAVAAGEIVDTSFVCPKPLVEFIHEQIDDAKAQGILFSVHLKATMMKVSDPIILVTLSKRSMQNCLPNFQSWRQSTVSIQTMGLQI